MSALKKRIKAIDRKSTRLYNELKFNIGKSERMAQVLKEEIRERIFKAALEEFFEKDFKTATMRDIAIKADIPTGLIYSYYKNKQALFEEIVQPVIGQLPQILKEAESTSGMGLENYFNIERKFYIDLLYKRKEFLLLMDKSAGTAYSNSKYEMISAIEQHIKIVLEKRSAQKYDEVLFHILATNHVESLLEIMRHYKSKEWAEEMLDLVKKQFFLGSDSL